MRRVTFFICLFIILLPLVLNSQPPKPRRAGTTIPTGVPDLRMSFKAQYLQFSPNGQMLAILPQGGSGLLLINFNPLLNPNVELSQQLLGQNVKLLTEKNITSFVFSPDDQILAIIPTSARYNSKTIELWNPHTEKRLKIISPNKGFTFSDPVFSSDGQTLATIHETLSRFDNGSRETIKLWDPHTGKNLRTLKAPMRGHKSVSLYDAAFSPDGQFLAATPNYRKLNARAYIELWDPNTGKHLRPLKVPMQGFQNARIGPLVFSPSGQILGTRVTLFNVPKKSDKKGSKERDLIMLWDPRTGKHLRNLELPGVRQDGIAFSPDEQILATLQRDKTGSRTILLWDPHTGKHLKSLVSPAGAIQSIVFSPKGQILAPSGGINIIPLWNPYTGKKIKTLTHNFEPNKKGATLKLNVGNVIFSPNGQVVAAIIGDFPVLWKIPSRVQGDDTRVGRDNARVEGETQFHQQLKNPESDGGGRWVNIKGTPLEDLDQVRTRYTGNETEIIFVNLTKAAITYYWLDGNGEEKYYGSIPAGGFVNQHTYVGHVWLVKDVPGYGNLVFKAVEKPGRVLLDP